MKYYKIIPVGPYLCSVFKSSDVLQRKNIIKRPVFLAGKQLNLQNVASFSILRNSHNALPASIFSRQVSHQITLNHANKHRACPFRMLFDRWSVFANACFFIMHASSFAFYNFFYAIVT